jgi:hypothetical protein
MLCFPGCKTTSAPETAKALAILVPPIPPAPVMEPVRFIDRDGGLWLSYEQYRSLERNVIALREYTAKLETIIDFTRSYHD